MKINANDFIANELNIGDIKSAGEIRQYINSIRVGVFGTNMGERAFLSYLTVSAIKQEQKLDKMISLLEEQNELLKNAEPNNNELLTKIVELLESEKQPKEEEEKKAKPKATSKKTSTK
jgi:methylthioribose-1-phosphate isomerase